jgi:hypothetical protein
MRDASEFGIESKRDKHKLCFVLLHRKIKREIVEKEREAFRVRKTQVGLKHTLLLSQ